MNKLECELEVTQLMKDRAMIRLPQSDAFGFRIRGVSVGPLEQKSVSKGDALTHTDEDEPAENTKTISDDVQNELEKKLITLSTRCSHPLAEPYLNLKDINPIWKNIYYVSPQTMLL